MKVSVVGGASFSTPALFRDIDSELSDCEFTLIGRSAERLGAVERAARTLAGVNALKVRTVVCTAEASASALAGADVVLIQMRVGNMAGRRFDEAFPLGFNLCGDEGLGAGGLSAAWRSWPTIEAWLEAIQKYAPKALILMMSSPVGVLTRAARLRFPQLRCFGICEVPFLAYQDIATLLRVDPSLIQFEYLGVNHIGWLYAVNAQGRDLTIEWADYPSRQGFPGSDIVRRWGGIPTKYLRLHFEASAALAEQKAVHLSRADQLESLQNSGYASYFTASDSQLRELLDRRETPWYSHSILPLLRGLLAGGSFTTFFLSGPNEAHRPEFASDDVLEIACRIEGGTLRRLRSTIPAPRPIAALIHDFCLHERYAVDAVISRNSFLLRQALHSHPWVARMEQSETIAARLADTIVNGNAQLESGQHPRNHEFAGPACSPLTG